jgi:hypothetical protein
VKPLFSKDVAERAELAAWSAAIIALLVSGALLIPRMGLSRSATPIIIISILAQIVARLTVRRFGKT